LGKTETLHNLRLGSTRVTFRGGDPIEHVSEALYVSVNARSVMASGFAGAVRIAAGQEVERELRSHGDLLLGTAYLVGPGNLAERGVTVIACGVTAAAPGLPPKRALVQDAFAMALDLLVERGTRALTLPEIGTRIPGITLGDAAGILTRTVAARLRQGSRLTDITIASLHPEYLGQCHARLLSAGAVPE
jgi:O-acetyl-ADP-ribose deacetylase